MPPRKRKPAASADDAADSPVQDGTKKPRTTNGTNETAASSRPKRASRVSQAPATGGVNGSSRRGNKEIEGRPAKTKNNAPAPITQDTKTPSAKPKPEKNIPKTTAEAQAEAETSSGKSYWLMKAEPESRFEKGVDVKFSIDDLREAKEPEPWDGVRNAAARNNMRAMKKGDLAFFYHSNCKVPGIAGVMEIVQEHSIDESAFDPAHPYYDEKSKRDNPKWEVVHVEFRRKFKELVTLADLKSFGKPGGPLENMQMMRQSRLSVSAVGEKEWEFIMGLVEKK
ncbi:hypothetical protein FQN50_004078 [Emmonsiellopsis sp. PD_5]|nr:hypothetical protein FQN50_004078 [Emmonsiellopsis sp. PD_5]